MDHKMTKESMMEPKNKKSKKKKKMKNKNMGTCYECKMERMK